MKVFTERNNSEVIQILQSGGVGVLKTDTLYGVVASILYEDAVERVYSLRKRDLHKPCIILIADISQLSDVKDGALLQFMDAKWPGPVSIVVPAPDVPRYLKREEDSIALRIPADTELRELLAQTGPLIAPSANVQGEKPAKNIAEARAYFGEKVDFYVDSGDVENITPSQLWTCEQGDMKRLR